MAKDENEPNPTERRKPQCDGTRVTCGDVVFCVLFLLAVLFFAFVFMVRGTMIE